MKILVTGGAGFIGSNLVDALIYADHDVLIIDNLMTGRRKNINKKAAFFEQDIRKRRECQDVFELFMPDVVVHLAAQNSTRMSVMDPFFDEHINIGGSLNMLSLSANTHVKHFIFASTSAVYEGVTGYAIGEDDRTNPLSPYGVAKLAVEKYMGCFWGDDKIRDVTALRFGNIYGPRQRPDLESGVIAIFADKMLRGAQPTIYGDGTKERDFVYVDDLVEGICRVIDRPITGTYNFGSNRGLSIATIYEYLAELIGYKEVARFAEDKPGEAYQVMLDSSTAYKYWDWHPETPIEVGMQHVIDALEAEYDYHPDPSQN